MRGNFYSYVCLTTCLCVNSSLRVFMSKKCVCTVPTTKNTCVAVIKSRQNFCFAFMLKATHGRWSQIVQKTKNTSPKEKKKDYPFDAIRTYRNSEKKKNGLQCEHGYVRTTPHVVSAKKCVAQNRVIVGKKQIKIRMYIRDHEIEKNLTSG